MNSSGHSLSEKGGSREESSLCDHPFHYTNKAAKRRLFVWMSHTGKDNDFEIYL